MAYPIALKQKAIKLRKNGYSIKEIAHALSISQGTSSVWVRDVEISTLGKKKLIYQSNLYRYNTSKRWKEKRKAQNSYYKNLAKNSLKKVILNNSNLKLICSILFWTEGAKNSSQVRFINSDPNMIRLFLHLLRNSFDVEEKKFRLRLHLHDYHDRKEMESYWTKLTNIPKSQLGKTYLKPNTKIRKKPGYKGCAVITYYDYRFARELEAIYNAFSDIGV